jgi:hypothetical protein
MKSSPGRKGGNYALAVMPAPQEEIPVEEEPTPEKNRRRFGFFRRKRAGDDEPAAEENNEPTANVVLQEASKVNDETIASLQRTEKVMYETEAIGNETANKIAEGKETLQNVDSTVDGFEPITKRAQRDVLHLARGLARDKCFLCLGFTVVLVVVAIIIGTQVWPDAVSEAANLSNSTLPSI